MSQCAFIDGTAYAASDFGSTDATTGEWKPNGDGSIRKNRKESKITCESVLFVNKISKYLETILYLI